MKNQLKANALLDEAKQKINQAQSLLVSKPSNTGNVKALIGRINAALFDGKMNEEQSSCILGFSVIYAMFLLLGRVVPIQFLSYALATIYHETGRTMLPIEEWGKGKGRPYGEPDPKTGQRYFGRGYVQLTWIDNYRKAMQTTFDQAWKKGTVDFVNDPNLALVPFYAAQITISGMTQGWFTGKKLSDYVLPNGGYDYVNARRIINGLDKAEMIAAYALDFEKALFLSIGRDIERLTVKIGDSGDDVRELQLGLGLNPDGVFGNATKTALIHFQNKHKLNPDGVCGQDTWLIFDKEIYGL